MSKDLTDMFAHMAEILGVTPEEVAEAVKDPAHFDRLVKNMSPEKAAELEARVSNGPIKVVDARNILGKTTKVNQ